MTGRLDHVTPAAPISPAGTDMKCAITRDPPVHAKVVDTANSLATISLIDPELGD